MTVKNTVLTSILLFFVTIEVLIALDYLSKHQALNKQRVAMYNSFIELQNQLGYGGLIHNFKNNILRPTETTYRDKALENHQKASMQLAQLEKLGNNLVTKLAMPHTRGMLEAYKSRIELLPDLAYKNLTPDKIDQLVRYDDKLALLEIRNTSTKVTAELDTKINEVLYRSLTLGGVMLIGLVISLISIVRYFFKEQQRLLEYMTEYNVEMQQYKFDMQRSQSILLSVMQDVEREKRQAALLNKQLKSKNQEMEQFIYTVSHDLKSPLVTISGFAQKLVFELKQSITEKQLYRLQRIIDSVKNMEALLTDLLDLSKIVQKDIGSTELEVKTIVLEQAKRLEEEITETQTTIRFADNLHKVTANPTLLSQAILNLLSNAIHYRDPSRQLVIDISTSHAATATTVHVQDNGKGIDHKYHQLIFNIFERLSAEQDCEGTGVGLTIVKTIMEKHNGKIKLKSELGKGSCFSLTFPDYPSNKAS